MKLFISTLALLLSNHYLHAQTDCDQLLAQKIILHEEDFEKMEHELVINFSKLSDCGLDETDIVFWGQPAVLSAFVIGWMNDDTEKVTYQRLLDEILEMKATSEYNEVVKMYHDIQLLKSKKIELSNWDIDSKLLLEILKDERIVHSIYQLILLDPNQYETYGAMMDDFTKMADSYLSNHEVIEGKPNFYKDAEIISYDEILKKAKDSRKPLLIYFTSYADVNSRKMEDAFLYDDDIQDSIETNYYTIPLYVDSKKEVPEEFIKLNSKTGEKMKTYGSFYIQMQEDQFHENRQPLFIIIDKEGNVLKKQGFTLKKKEFKKFIK